MGAPKTFGRGSSKSVLLLALTLALALNTALNMALYMALALAVYYCNDDDVIEA